MEGPIDQRPAGSADAVKLGVEDVDELRLLSAADDVKLVEAVDASGALEPEADSPPRVVVFDPVANGSVTAASAELQRPVEAHGGPAAGGPQPVVGTREPIDEGSQLLFRRVDPTSVSIVDMHGGQLHPNIRGQSPL